MSNVLPRFRHFTQLSAKDTPYLLSGNCPQRLIRKKCHFCSVYNEKSKKPGLLPRFTFAPVFYVNLLFLYYINIALYRSGQVHMTGQGFNFLTFYKELYFFHSRELRQGFNHRVNCQQFTRGPAAVVVY